MENIHILEEVLSILNSSLKDLNNSEWHHIYPILRNQIQRIKRNINKKSLYFDKIEANDFLQLVYETRELALNRLSVEKLNSTRLNLLLNNLTLIELYLLQANNTDNKYIIDHQKKAQNLINNLNEINNDAKKSQDDFDNYIKELKEDNIAKIKETEEQISSMLNAAGTVGLAKAFTDQKNYFKKQTVKWEVFFMGAIISTIIIISSLVILSIYKNFDLTTLSIKLLPVYMPVIWLLFFCSKRRNEFATLTNEYIHKETIALSFTSYKEEATHDESLSIELLKTSIENFADNPCHALKNSNSHEHPIFDMLKKFIENKKD
ncbi:hypothetical protein [Francisella philomiragia]|uniref:hypothetical protein n=1 Tax=Francisella philomiragia TaxID=28110 RepID=UPI002242E8D8|nr:hypothetical protein [Francisella philomiragia]